MAEIFVHPDNPDNYLRVCYQRVFWKVLVKYAPTVLQYLREHGVEAWLERYGLPPDPWRQVGEDYLKDKDPRSVELRNFWYSDQPPKLPRLEDFLQGLREYDPSLIPGPRWKKQALERIEQYMKAVEEAYTQAGWQRVRIKNKEKLNHFIWLALRLEGYSYERIADTLGLKEGEDTVRKGCWAAAKLLGIAEKSPYSSTQPKGGGGN